MNLRKIRLTLQTGISLFTNFSFKQKITMTIMLFTLVPLIAYSPIYLTKEWQEKIDITLAYNKLMLENSANWLHNLMERGANDSISLSRDSEYLQIINLNEKEMLPEIIDIYDHLHSTFFSYNNLNYSDSLFLYSYTVNKNVLSGDFSRPINLLEKNTLTWLEQNQANDLVWSIDQIKIGFSQGSASEKCFCAYYCLRSYDESIQAVIQFGIPMQTIEHAFDWSRKQEIASGSFTALVLNNQKTYSFNEININPHQCKKHLEEFIKTGKSTNYYVISKELVITTTNSDYFLNYPLNNSRTNDDAITKAGSIKVLLFVPKQYTHTNLISFILFNIVLAFFIFVIIYVAVHFTSLALTKKISNLIVEINKNVPDYISNPQQHEKKVDELSLISNHFYELINTIKIYYAKINAYEVERARLELELLQERINPHFLYNTIGAIRRASPDAKLTAVINSLVKYYRVALNQGKEVINLAQEIEMIREYLNIQQFAYESDLQFSIEIDPSIQDCRIMKHILQPIVENAFIHGVNLLPSGGVIRIKGETTPEGKIKLTVADNGLGMSRAEIAAAIGEMEQKPDSNKGTGYGISNVIKRLRLEYGETCSFMIDSVPGQGTEVTILFPAVK